MKIEIGEYIKTNVGNIGKVKRIEFDEIDTSLKWYVFDKRRPDMNVVDEIYINKPYIVKHSKNIIDLIEVGDYVNGHLIIDKNNKILMYEDADYINGANTISNFEIKSIVTKEQFKSVEYRLEE